MAKVSFFDRKQPKRNMSTEEAVQNEQEIITAQNTDPDNDPATDPTLSAAADEAVSQQAEAMVAQADYDRVTQERDQLQDRLARLQAEFDNARKREARERSESRDIMVGSAVQAFLPALDNFDLALKAQGTPEQFRQGVELIARQLQESLKSLGVQAVETVGVQFNPHLHEALGSVDTSDVPDHQVVEELRRGYKLKERLLRPAQVRVASNQGGESKTGHDTQK
jgi:molecular chaperone GrpE